VFWACLILFRVCWVAGLMLDRGVVVLELACLGGGVVRAFRGLVNLLRYEKRGGVVCILLYV